MRCCLASDGQNVAGRESDLSGARGEPVPEREAALVQKGGDPSSPDGAGTRHEPVSTADGPIVSAQSYAVSGSRVKKIFSTGAEATSFVPPSLRG